MLTVAGAIYGLAATSAFGFDRLEVNGTGLTTEDAIRASVGLEPGTNLVGLATEPIEARIRELPSVQDARVDVGLPDVLRVDVTERRPIVIWAVGDRRSDVTADPTGLTKGMPTVSDERVSANGLAVASTLDPVDLDAATRLGSLTPSQVGSRAAAFRVHVTDERGFTISTGSGGWVAVFGFYGLSQRTPALIPGQVQLLGSLLSGREDTVATVILADGTEGSYTAKPTARPKPSATVKP
jgi:hypothetical protein